MAQSTSPPSKRVKLESLSPVTTPRLNAEEDVEEGGSSCSICLQEISDQTILPTCSHEFCFECLLIWTKQSRRCPLCSREIGEYLIHNVRSKHDFSKHYLIPLRSSPVLQNPLISTANLQRVSGRRRLTAREQARERRQREELNEVDKLQQSIGKRRWIYRNGLYAKHVASNAFTRYKHYPLPAQFSVSPDLISRTTSFVRRELQIWPNLDIEFLTTFTISIMKSIDIRSESAVKLLAEFLDLDSSYIEGGRHVNAEHFAHEIYSFVRSPYRDIFVYDDVVQYDIPPDVAPPPRFNPRRRWRRNSPSRSQSRTGTPSGSHSRSPSWSPSESESASLQIIPPITHNESDEPLCRPPLSRRGDDNSGGHMERTRPPLPAREMGSPRCQTIAQLGSNPEERNGSETREEKEHSSLDHRDPVENPKPHGAYPLFRTHVVVNNKGKQRAFDAQGNKKNDFDNVVQGKPSEQEIKIQREHNLETLPSCFAQPKVIERKLPRNRTLRQCVEAHLSNGKRKSPEGNGGREDTDLDDKKGYLYADNPAALSSDSYNSIFRLTDQVHIAGHDNVASTHSLQGADPVNETADGKMSQESHASPIVSQRKPRIISPRDIDTAMLAIETSTQDILLNQERVISTDIDHVGKDRSGHAINNSADRDIHRAVRSRLVSRLNEEKIYAYAKTAAGSAFSAAEPQIVEPAGNHHVLDSQAVEDNLRKRARLRMKLAAEKRGIMNVKSG